ncbi:hypothetical protein GCM10010339_44190 [Streptomyces alanosinicus]|uniref:Transposase IS701-like DDE domain-containing protein n=1 Tax=Streptomyces alanosinicus TaxID=68171 RepID=A0A918YK51_9ACTN|nr:hypothetical protein GCM10010339_44190 [Streptomyces alanosinicus]
MQFGTRPRLATEMIAAALDAKITAAWMTGDKAYGQDPHLRAGLEERGIGYVLAVVCSTRVRINQGRTPIRADALADRLPATAWHRHSTGRGAKGPRHYDRAWIGIGHDSHRHLLIRRNRTTSELAFHLCWSPTQVTLSQLVRVAGIRRSVEECFQAAKSQAGLDHYQVRHWTSRHRHITLAMLAPAFLTAPAAGADQDRPIGPLHPSRTNTPVPVTVPEIRHLLAAVLATPVTSTARLLHWSNWRRYHQAVARRCHYQRRSADELTRRIMRPHWSAG